MGRVSGTDLIVEDDCLVEMCLEPCQVSHIHRSCSRTAMKEDNGMGGGSQRPVNSIPGSGWLFQSWVREVSIALYWLNSRHGWLSSTRIRPDSEESLDRELVRCSERSEKILKQLSHALLNGDRESYFLIKKLRFTAALCHN